MMIVWFQKISINHHMELVIGNSKEGGVGLSTLKIHKGKYEAIIKNWKFQKGGRVQMKNKKELHGGGTVYRHFLEPHIMNKYQ